MMEAVDFVEISEGKPAMAHENLKTKEAIGALPPEELAGEAMVIWALAPISELSEQTLAAHWNEALISVDALLPFAKPARKLCAAVSSRWGLDGAAPQAEEVVYWAGLANLISSEGGGPNGASKIERFERRGRRIFLGRTEEDWTAWRECCAALRRCIGRVPGVKDDSLFQWLAQRLDWAKMKDSEAVCVAASIARELPKNAFQTLSVLCAGQFSWSKLRFESFARAILRGGGPHGHVSTRGEEQDALAAKLMSSVCHLMSAQGFGAPAAETVAWAWSGGQMGMADALRGAGARVDLLASVLEAMKADFKKPDFEIWSQALALIESCSIERSSAEWGLASDKLIEGKFRL